MKHKIYKEHTLNIFSEKQKVYLFYQFNTDKMSGNWINYFLFV